jgi:hypothetical protein
MLDAKRYAPMNARDKMPFEVTPIFYKLQRYETAHVAPPAAAPATAAPAAAAPGPSSDQPAAGQQNAAPPAPPAAGDASPQSDDEQTIASAQGPQ